MIMQRTNSVLCVTFKLAYDQCRRLASTLGLLRGIRVDSFVKLLARRAYNLTGGEVSGRGSRVRNQDVEHRPPNEPSNSDLLIR